MHPTARTPAPGRCTGAVPADHPRLVHLNGPPGVGKSTLARLLAADDPGRPAALPRGPRPGSRPRHHRSHRGADLPGCCARVAAGHCRGDRLTSVEQAFGSSEGVTMRVLGIDPGLTRCGWGVVEGRPGARPAALGVGVVRSSAELDLELRLLELHTSVAALLREFRPDVVAVERVFTQNNKGTAMGTAQAAGVAALAAAQADRPVAWHTPSEVKAAISGNGRADKEQVTLMVTRVLGLAAAPKPADAADALALAICQVWRGPAQHRLTVAALAGGLGAPVVQRTLPRWQGVSR